MVADKICVLLHGGVNMKQFTMRIKDNNSMADESVSVDINSYGHMRKILDLMLECSSEE